MTLVTLSGAGRGRCVVYAHPEDAARLASVSFRAGTVVEPDESVSRGSVRVATTGLARASTVNGSVTISMGRANWADELEFSTVNGSITLELPASLEAVVSASTVNGSFYSDWPMMVRGKWGPKRVNGTIGNGGRELALSTVNGDIELRKN